MQRLEASPPPSINNDFKEENILYSPEEPDITVGPGLDGQHVDPASMDLALPEAFLEEKKQQPSTSFEDFKKAQHLPSLQEEKEKQDDKDREVAGEIQALTSRTEALLFHYHYTLPATSKYPLNFFKYFIYLLYNSTVEACRFIQASLAECLQ